MNRSLIALGRPAIAVMLLLAAVFLSRCDQRKSEAIPKMPIKNTIRIQLPDQETDSLMGYKVIVIDSCEYIYAWFGAANGGGSLTHKGNCKFCAARHSR